MFSKRTCFACNSRHCIAALPDMPLFVCEACNLAHGLVPLAWADIDNKLAAPWTVEQVASLNGYQQSSTFFPFVCTNLHPAKATLDGLECERCDWHLGWAYDWTLNWEWKFLEPPNLSGAPVNNRPGK